MSKDTEQLLVRQKPLEASRPPFIRTSATTSKAIISPDKAPGHREKSLHQLFLAADGDIDMAISHARTNVGVTGGVHMVHCGLGTLVVLELNKAAHSFASRAFHDDMNRTLRLMN